MATITLSNQYALDSLKLRGEKGMFEVTRGDTKISPFVASHYLSSNKVTITYTESDREGLIALPKREMGFMATALQCAENQILNKILPVKVVSPKPKRKSKAKPKPKITKEILEEE